MAFDTSDLFPASFRGINFLVSKTSTVLGPKIVTHEFPHDSRRYDEDMGSFKKTFTITGYVTGDEYIVNKDALEKALSNGSIGLLVHPFDGPFNVTPKFPVTVTQDIDTIGVAVFTMTFDQSDPPANPSQSGDLFSKILSSVQNLDDQLQSAFEKAFFITNLLPNTILSSRAKLNQVSSEFTGFVNQFSLETVNTSDLLSEQNTFTNQTLSTISTTNGSKNIANGISSIFETANSISENPLQSGNAFASLFTFGKSDKKVSVLSREGSIIQFNNELITYIFAVYSLMYAYFNFTQTIFADTNQLRAAENLLESQYLKILNGTLIDYNQINSVDVLSIDVFDALYDLRTIAKQQFTQDELNTSNIVQIRFIEPMPVAILSYLYYETTDQYDDIISLNNIADIPFAVGTLNILTTATQ